VATIMLRLREVEHCAAISRGGWHHFSSLSSTWPCWARGLCFETIHKACMCALSPALFMEAAQLRTFFGAQYGRIGPSCLGNTRVSTMTILEDAEPPTAKDGQKTSAVRGRMIDCNTDIGIVTHQPDASLRGPHRERISRSSRTSKGKANNTPTKPTPLKKPPRPMTEDRSCCEEDVKARALEEQCSLHAFAAKAVQI